MAEGTVGHGIGLDGIGLLPQIAPWTQQRQPLDRLLAANRHTIFPWPTSPNSPSTVPQSTVLPFLHHALQRVVCIVVGGWKHMLWRKAILWQHHPTTRHTDPNERPQRGTREGSQTQTPRHASTPQFLRRVLSTSLRHPATHFPGARETPHPKVPDSIGRPTQWRGEFAGAWPEPHPPPACGLRDRRSPATPVWTPILPRATAATQSQLSPPNSPVH